mgnify:FL=1
MNAKIIFNQIKDGLLYASLVIVALVLIRGIANWIEVGSLLLMGVIIALANLLYLDERLSTRTVFIIHYVITTVTIFSINALNHWVPTNVGALLGEWLLISAIYFIVWFFTRHLTTRSVTRANELLNQINHKGV